MPSCTLGYISLYVYYYWVLFQVRPVCSLQCSAIVNASIPSSSLQVPFPSSVTLFFIFSCLYVSYFGEVCQSPPAVGLPVPHLGGTEQQCSWLSWTYGQLHVNHLLMDCGQWTHIYLCFATTCWWTVVNGHTYTYVLYQSGIWLAPSAGVVRSDLRCRVRSLFFPKGF